MPWQKNVRVAIAVGGVGFAGAVFFAIGERENTVPPPTPARLDPKAVIESSNALFRQVRGIEQDYEVRAQRQLTYDDGSSRLIEPEITVRDRGGRDFVMSGNEARAEDKNREIIVSGEVKLAASDGFEVHTDRATFSEADGVVRAPGPLRFQRGRMSGSGVGMTYDKNNDVLTIVDQAHVQLTNEHAKTVMEFSGGNATLTRQDNFLLVERSVHALRGQQVLESDKATARLTDNEEHITFIELRGNSRVGGGSDAFDSMSARDIDLDYSDDGEVLERVSLNGNGTIQLTGRADARGQQLRGDSLEVRLAPDGTATAAGGRSNVYFGLAAGKNYPARSVSAERLDATGEAGKGLTMARFSGNVEYREAAQPPNETSRVARSQTLRATLVGDAVANALFVGSVIFEEQRLQAGAAEATYDPDAGWLRLNGVDQGGGPRVSDDQVSITADAIHVTLEGRRMMANGAVKTVLQPNGAKADIRMPGLLQETRVANVNAVSLDYDGAAGRAIYTGNAQLWQGETAVRADRLLIDRRSGDLIATGTARSTILMNNGASIGRGEEVRYEDGKRQVIYLGAAGALGPSDALGAPRAEDRGSRGSSPSASKARIGLDAPTAPDAPLAQLSGPEGDLRSDRIVVSLAKSDSRVDRLEAAGRVALRLDTRLATGAHLVYEAADERYVMTGIAGVPVAITEHCRDTRGKTLIFFKSTDRIVVDGNEEIRTQTKGSGGPCPDPRSRETTLP